MTVRVLIPEADMIELLGPIPEGVAVEIWNGREALVPGPPIDLWVPDWDHTGHTFAKLFSQLPGLRAVQLLTAGYDGVQPYLPEGVMLYRAAGAHDGPVAEWVVAVMLTMLRGLPDYVRRQDRGVTRPVESETLAGKVVLLLGYGSIASAIEARLDPFGVRLIRVARLARPSVHAIGELGALLPEAHIVVILLPLSDTTRNLVDAECLALLPDGALVINAARGGVLDQRALAVELAAGRLRAALDVADPDPLPAGDPLLASPNLLYTPHVANVTNVTKRNAYRFVGEQIGRLATGQAMKGIVNPPQAQAALRPSRPGARAITHRSQPEGA